MGDADEAETNEDETERLLMTPGPTALPREVREAMGRRIHNPDVEPEFTELYRSLLEKLAAVYGTDDECVILAGEGMLGLEAGVSSLVDPGETVLSLSNGIYGTGFTDLVETHDGEAVLHEVPFDEPLEVDRVEEAIETHEPRVATMVHCETPTGTLNDLDPVLGTLDDAGVLTVVDAVSSIGGTPVPTERIDVCLAASQKCFSSPPGLATLSVSDEAWAKVAETEQDSFYASLEPWRDLSFDEPPAAFPYTQSVSNCYALEASLDRLLEEGLETVFERHETAAKRCRERGHELGLEPYPPEELSSPTVTAFEVDGRAGELRERVAEEGVVLATGLGEMADDLLRVGHMGYNAELGKVDRAMDAIEAALR
jgi:aspartate aminotransferase-like enzyme